MLSTEYRPRDWSDVAGQDAPITALRSTLDRAKRKGSPLAIWIGGPSGCGKTTLAEIAARDVGASDIDITDLDGAGCDLASVKDLERGLQLGTLGGSGWRVVIVNEAHAMSAGAVQAWLTLLERLPARRLVIFTSTERGAFGPFDAPFRRRCVSFALSPVDCAAGAARLRAIADAESIRATDRQLAALVAECGGNLGLAISRLDSGDIPPGPAPAARQSEQKGVANGISSESTRFLASLGIA